MVPGISLSNKSQILFGVSALIIITIALSVPWIRFHSVVGDAEMESARRVAATWLSAQPELEPKVMADLSLGPLLERGVGAQRITLVAAAPAARPAADNGADADGEVDADAEPASLAQVRTFFAENAEAREHVIHLERDDLPIMRYVRALRRSELAVLEDAPPGERVLTLTRERDDDDAAAQGGITAFLIVDRVDLFAERQLFISEVYVVAAGIAGFLLAIVVFYLILTKLILSPVRKLRRTTEKVQQGNLAIRSELETGDEFQELSEAFNAMLDRLEMNQTQLRAMNESLDLKLNELAETNVGLFESNRIKNEFVANVSHELRTPLNSIIGFAELLDEMAQGDAQADPKRVRYIQNILSSGRRLLEMINELLDMAKIESGRMEVTIAPTSVSDLVEGLAGIVRPLADARKIELSTKVSENIPAIETDAGKLQQILYNFISNAIKFTPEGGEVAMSAERMTRQDNSLGVRINVSDTGPGIPPDMQDIIFEKFRQLDSPHTKEHPGTGLGLAICRDLAQMIGAQVAFVSEAGRGTTFYVEVPQVHQPDEPQPLMR